MPARVKEKHALILGCGRSGTSILGELFGDNPHYSYYCEPPYSDLTQCDFSTPVAVKVPTESPGFPPSPGLSFPLRDLLSLTHEGWQIFWIVRHPLDAICSLRVGIELNWGHHPRPPDWQKWLTRPLLERCAHHWNHINSTGFRQVSHLAHVVHFEEMIRRPRVFAADALKQVGLEPHEHQQVSEKWCDRVQDSNNAQFIEAECSRNYSRPDHTVRIERWRENLKDDEIESVIPMVQATAKKFGYAL